MSSPDPDPSDVISPEAYELIMRSPDLRLALMPEGLVPSPYRILSYDATLTLMDPDGKFASFERTQRVMFQQDGVTALLDHFWGDGITAAQYSTTAGPLGRLFTDSGRRHLMIELPRPMMRGDVFEFGTERIMMEAFQRENEYFEVTIDHPIVRLGCVLLFPRERPCLQAAILIDGRYRSLEIADLPGGKSFVRLEIPNAEPHTVYRVEWQW
jgi:hypothetical protein